MARIINLFFGSSIFIFLVMLLYVYAYLPVRVGVLYDGQGIQNLSVTKEIFFYSTIALFVFINGLIYLYRKMLKGNGSFENYDWNQMTKKEVWFFWLHGLNAIINFTLIFSVMFLGMYHNQEHFNVTNFSFLIYLGPILFFSWFFSLFYFLKNAQ